MIGRSENQRPNRLEKVNSILGKEISNILLKDFNFSPDVLVTVTRVKSATNFFEAKVYISVFPESKSEGIMNALNKSVRSIQVRINKILRMRPVPKIRFMKDVEVSRASRVEELLAGIGKDLPPEDSESSLKKEEK